MSFLPLISLIFERLLFNYFFELCKDQFRRKQFRKNAVLRVIEYLGTLYGNNAPTLLSIYLDYEKALDKVPHQILSAKLKLFGFDPELLALFFSSWAMISDQPNWLLF